MLGTWSALSSHARFVFANSSEFQQLVLGFGRLHRRLPASTSRWIEQGNRESNIVRLSFGMGVTARFAPDSMTSSAEYLRRR